MRGSFFQRLAAQSAATVDRVFGEPIEVTPTAQLNELTGQLEEAGDGPYRYSGVVNFTHLEGRLDGSRPGNQVFNQKVDWTLVEVTLSDLDQGYQPEKNDTVLLLARADAPALKVTEVARDEYGRIKLELAAR